MEKANKMVGTMERDKLIYDMTHPIDAKVIKIKISAKADGKIKRGQVIDFKEDAYSIHSADGEVSVIAAEDVEYTSTDTEIMVPVYISGTFRASEVIADPELTDKDMEKLRGKGIYLK